jgi:penicillin-binding protein 1A
MRMPDLRDIKWPIKFYAILVVLAILGSLFAVSLALAYRDELPSIEQIYNIEPPVVTTIYDRNGKVLQKFHIENRVLVPFNKIPPHVIQALIATEDDRFYDHWGVEWRGVARAVFRNVFFGFGSGGGSTISQQLSRMLFLSREISMERKIKEAMTALKIERTYSKNEILEMYLNLYYFGNSSYGIETAARNYFNKNAEALTIDEGALLVAIVNAPTRYSPIDHPDRALQRRNYVLSRMESEGYINESLCEELKKTPIKLDLSQNAVGAAPYFTEMVRQYLTSKYGNEQFYKGGLNVYTTIDTRLQQVAEQSMHDQLDSIQTRIERTKWLGNPQYCDIVYDSVKHKKVYQYKQIQGAFVGIDNETGDILTMIGGKDFNKYKYNRAMQAKRQPGSAFKPFVYTAAVMKGYHPCDIFYDTPIVLTIPGSTEWSPHNFDDEFQGAMPLRTGLARSRNLIAIKLLQMVGAKPVIEVAHKMGIASPLAPNPSLAIGTSEVDVLELVSAYTCFPNGGIHVAPRFITKVIDRYGNLLEENGVAPRQVAIPPAPAYMMVNLMQSVMDDSGATGAGARTRGFYRPAGGKTGTSDNFCDAWFVGYTAQVTAGCWIGFDDKTSLGHNQTGSLNALPIWADFMTAAVDSLPVEDFPEPPGITHMEICVESGKKAAAFCPHVRDEVFLSEYQITDVCPLHRKHADAGSGQGSPPKI